MPETHKNLDANGFCAYVFTIITPMCTTLEFAPGSCLWVLVFLYQNDRNMYIIQTHVSISGVIYTNTYINTIEYRPILCSNCTCMCVCVCVCICVYVCVNGYYCCIVGSLITN